MDAALSNRPGRIVAMAEPGEGGRLWRIGFKPIGADSEVIGFEPVQYPGEQSWLPWVRVHYADGTTEDVNVRMLASIRYSAEGDAD